MFSTLEIPMNVKRNCFTPKLGSCLGAVQVGRKWTDPASPLIQFAKCMSCLQAPVEYSCSQKQSSPIKFSAHSVLEHLFIEK